MATADPYAGRTVDVLAFRGQTPTGTALLAQDLLSGGGQICTGIVKLAQWFVLELLRIQGSAPFDADGGTLFYQRLASGRFRTDTDVYVAFGFAVGDITARARQVETAATPLDEQFAAAVLDAVTVAPGKVTLHVALTSAAGTARQVILPIPFTPR